MKTHSLRRTVPKGQIGPWRCIHCGVVGFMEIMNKPCPNGIDQNIDLLEALDPSNDNEPERNK